MNCWQRIWGSLYWALIICKIICTDLAGYDECGQLISRETNSTSKITWEVHSKWFYAWRALKTFDKAEFKLLKCIRDEFISSIFQCLHTGKSPGYLEVSGRHREICRSPFPPAGGVNARVRGWKITYFQQWNRFWTFILPILQCFPNFPCPRIRWELSRGCPPSSPCPEMATIQLRVSSFLPGTQLAKAHSKPSAALLEHVASSQHSQGSPAAREVAHQCSHHLCHFTRAPLGISTLPFYMSSLTIADNTCNATRSHFLKPWISTGLVCPPYSYSPTYMLSKNCIYRNTFACCRGRTCPHTRRVGISLLAYNVIL